MKIGDLLDGKYEILQQLGVGGMGEVYKARHTYLGTIRVIKVIRPSIAFRQDLHERFLREAQLATRVHHPNVATLHDFSALPDGRHYTVWEFIDGEDVSRRLRAMKTLPPPTALRVAIETLLGLEAIHRAGIVHRDISPENLMLTRDGDHVKIIDLGVARSDETATKITRAGVFVGKFRYASPEQLGFIGKGEEIDGRADLYSLAIVLYEMLAGRQPFEASTPQEYVTLHSQEREPRPIELDSMPGGAELQAILVRSLERERERRFPNAHEFAEALRSVENSLFLSVTVPTWELPAPAVPLTTLPAAPNPASTETARATIPAGAAPPPASAAPTAKAAPTLLIPAIVIGLAIVTAAIAAALILRQPQQPAVAPVTRKQVPVTAPVPPPATITAAATGPPVVPQQTAAPAATERQPPAQEPRPVTKPAGASRARARKPEPEERGSPEPDARPASPVLRSYVHGGDPGANAAAIREARESLGEVTGVAVRGEPSPLLEVLKARVAAFTTVEENADVVVRFSGELERFRFGRKRRSASATITRRGRVVFRYDLPPETYLVGDDPAGEFARVLREILR